MVSGRGLGFGANRVKGLRLRAIGLGSFLRPNQILEPHMVAGKLEPLPEAECLMEFPTVRNRRIVR